MIVYGDHSRVIAPSASIDALDRKFAIIADTAPGLERHTAIVGAHIEAGQLAQGILDARFHSRGSDEEEDVERVCAVLLLQSASVLVQSRAEVLVLGTNAVRESLRTLSSLELPETATVKEPEGYAYYSLYPEAYAAASERWRAQHSGELVAIGLRSIGTSLAPVVTAASGANAAPIFLRPVGHPFRRELRVGPQLERRLLSRAAESHFAVVDEGPGLSGSSFNAVAQWLEARGVPRSRIHFFPSHAGEPGAASSEEIRESWRNTSRCFVSFEEEILSRSQLLGSSEREEVSGGRWRKWRYETELEWPPVNMMQERRKYLLRESGRLVLARFAGVGLVGEETFARASVLSHAGFTPVVLAFRHGFTFEEWLDDAVSLRPEQNVSIHALEDWLAKYISFRCDHFTADKPGASVDELFEMAFLNTREAFGAELGDRVEALRGVLPRVKATQRPVLIDGRMHAWEWLVLPDGRVLKTDAVDHCHSHDLIGPQDIAWDVVGAAVELGVNEESLFERASCRGLARARDGGVLQFYRICYLAFQLGAATMAVQSHGFDAGEAVRLERLRERYAERLRLDLGSL